MKQMSRIVFVVVFMSVLSAGQVSQVTTNSPDEVLDRYFKAINDGGLLTADGWRRAAALFVRQSLAPRDKVIVVTTKHPLGAGPMTIKGSHAEADEKWVDDLGTIDSALRYKSPPRESIEYEGTIRIYHLVLTDEHWELAADGKSEKEMRGQPKWRIEGSLTMRSASREAAIRYVTDMRDKATDTTIRRNADRTITILKRLPAPRTHI